MQRPRVFGVPVVVTRGVVHWRLQVYTHLGHRILVW